MRAVVLAAALMATMGSVAAIGPACAQASTEDFSGWQKLVPRFPSTGGGGVMIDGYWPTVQGDTCATDFTATEPGGTVHRNRVVFDAVKLAGGILCTNGRWHSLEGDAKGTTPFRVFFRDGVAYASPPA